MAHPHPTILRLPTVKDRTGLSRSTIYKFIAADRFPKPVRLGPRAVGWLESGIDDWIAGRVAESRESAAYRPGPDGFLRRGRR